MQLIDQIQNYLPILGTFVGIVAWFIKLESNNGNIKLEVKEMRERLRSVEQKAAAIDGISGDIKGMNAKLDILLRKANL